MVRTPSCWCCSIAHVEKLSSRPSLCRPATSNDRFISSIHFKDKGKETKEKADGREGWRRGQGQEIVQ